MCFLWDNDACPWRRGSDPWRKTTSWRLAYSDSCSDPLVFHVPLPGADELETRTPWETSPPSTPSFQQTIRVSQACPIDPILLAEPPTTPTTPILNRLKSTMSARGVTKNRARARKSVTGQLHAGPRRIHHESRKCSNPCVAGLDTIFGLARLEDTIP
ncbi:hypothetical protein EX30DRAFT_43031 [Ascodesmis nigricans]|uniref:Uncharacterized protein n=1 Tax=Ascodesmis nigricans TaxID=341454 RepID=A0A4S2MW99_9PEZI|nr:hypothetical protein EX30DRAFT_43031 [Ascodesmis nigricans]